MSEYVNMTVRQSLPRTDFTGRVVNNKMGPSLIYPD